jgi:SAM-dependent methyltransferase
MVLEYNTSALNQGIPEYEMHAVVGNLIDPSNTSSSELEAPEFYNFDIAAVGMGWHHFSDPSFAAKRLAERLKPGGVLLIIDFLPHEGFDHIHKHGNVKGEDRGHGHGHSHGEETPDGYGDSKMEGAAAHTVTHFGFSEKDIKKMFEGAGVGVNFKFVVVGKGIVFGSEGKSMRRTAFMARGRKG